MALEWEDGAQEERGMLGGAAGSDAHTWCSVTAICPLKRSRISFGGSSPLRESTTRAAELRIGSEVPAASAVACVSTLQPGPAPGKSAARWTAAVEAAERAGGAAAGGPPAAAAAAAATSATAAAARVVRVVRDHADAPASVGCRARESIGRST